MMRDVAILLVCYLVGAIPTGLLISRFFGGIDIREHGSRNIGATNVWRVLGWRLGLATFLIDVAKAAGILLAVGQLPPGALAHLPVFGGVAVLLGNFVNVFLKFKGGKGVATSLGVFLALAPKAIIVVFLIFVTISAISRYISLGSICAALVAPIIAYYFGYDRAVLIFIIAAALLIIVKHRANITRLMNGTENKIGKRKEAA
ncbi:glycerol-3-phosphate 1-O-acyltransferase PlsY [Candidatus Sumerlaeota bacterium]|nr:glycerol-3-phosphate 1-O-acyltransferase PlsY [Candidatus Sumerlaeota bacterium]